MKAYVCDACGETMKDPYEAKMRMFYIGVEFDYGYAFRRNAKTRKTKVHLCGDCYGALCEIGRAKIERGAAE